MWGEAMRGVREAAAEVAAVREWRRKERREEGEMVMEMAAAAEAERLRESRHADGYGVELQSGELEAAAELVGVMESRTGVRRRRERGERAIFGVSEGELGEESINKVVFFFFLLL